MWLLDATVCRRITVSELLMFGYSGRESYFCDGDNVGIRLSRGHGLLWVRVAGMGSVWGRQYWSFLNESVPGFPQVISVKSN
jgi:hypothetical protein